MLSVAYALIYLNIQVISMLAYELVKSQRSQLPEEHRDDLINSLWGFKQGKYKDVSEDRNVLLLFPLSQFSYLKRDGGKIEVIEQITGNKYCLVKGDSLFECANEAFSRKSA